MPVCAFICAISYSRKICLYSTGTHLFKGDNLRFLVNRYVIKLLSDVLITSRCVNQSYLCPTCYCSNRIVATYLRLCLHRSTSLEKHTRFTTGILSRSLEVISACIRNMDELLKSRIESSSANTDAK